MQPHHHQANTRLGYKDPKFNNPIYIGELYYSTYKEIKPIVDFKPYNIPNKEDEWEPI